MSVSAAVQSYSGEMKWNRGKMLPDRGRLETTLYYLYLSWAFKEASIWLDIGKTW